MGLKKLILLIFLAGLGGSLSAQQAQFQVDATGTDATIDSAISYSLDILSQYLFSTIPIKVKINYTPMTQLGPLGITFPNGIKDFPNAPEPGTWYPTCLANAINGTELNPNQSDMDVFLNSDLTWYFGTDSNPAPNEHDFVTVLLHEICHGLGFLSLAKVEQGLGSFGELTAVDFAPLSPSFPFPDQMGLPSAFDLFLVNDSIKVLTDTGIFQNPSTALMSEFTGNQVYYNGPFGVAANQSDMPKVEAPQVFLLGSSMTHLDENAYPAGDIDALMTPSSAPGEVNHSPGPIVLGMLKDIGWPDAEDTTTFVGAEWGIESLSVYPNPFQSRITTRFHLTRAQPVKITVLNPFGQVEEVWSDEIRHPGLHTLYFNTGDLGKGCYILQVTGSDFQITRKLIKVAD